MIRGPYTCKGIAAVNKNKRDRIARAFGQALKQARMQAGLTQLELALEADMDRTYPSLLERGLKQPTLSTFLVLATHCQVTPQWLLSETLAKLEGA